MSKTNKKVHDRYVARPKSQSYVESATPTDWEQKALTDRDSDE